MNTLNEPVKNTENPSPKSPKNLIIGLLIAAVVIMGGFLIFNNNKNSEVLQTQQSEIVKVTTEKSELQNSFDASLARLDSMSTMNTNMQQQLAGKEEEIASV